MFKCILVVVLLLPTGGCAREEPDKGEPEGAVASQGSRPELEGTESQRGEARVLLRQYLEIVSVVVQSGTAEPMVPELDELSVRARGLAGTPKFSTRFARLLEVTRVIFTPIEPGAEAEVEAKLVKFVREVLGPEAPVPAGGGLAAVAPAIVEEAISLYHALDGTDDREATIARYLRPLGIDPSHR